MAARRGSKPTLRRKGDYRKTPFAGESKTLQVTVSMMRAECAAHQDEQQDGANKLSHAGMTRARGICSRMDGRHCVIRRRFVPRAESCSHEHEPLRYLPQG